MQEREAIAKTPESILKCSAGFASALASVELTLLVILVLVLLVLAGAWIPQQDSSEQATLLAKYGTEGMALLKYSGLSNVYQSPVFLSAVALLFINLMACTVSRMAPRIKLKLQKKDFMDAQQIGSFREHLSLPLYCSSTEAIERVSREMKNLGYKVHPNENGNRIIIEKGNFGWLAAPITHLGLFMLITGVVISCCTSYSGKLFLLEGQEKSLKESVERKPLFGSIPELKVRLQSTRREDNEDGSPRQWYSTLSVVDSKGLKHTGDVSVNNPWTFDYLDFCQSDWKLAGVKILLADHDVEAAMEEMGHDSMGLLPLTQDLLLVLALKDANAPLRLYFKHAESKMPKLFSTLARGESTKDCPVPVTYLSTLLGSGIQFKCDPGLPVTYCAFFVLFLGAIFVATPSLRLWASTDEGEGSGQLFVGFNSIKSAYVLRRDLRQLQRKLESQRIQIQECAGKEVSGIDS